MGIIIVVEGKTDSQKIQSLYNEKICFFETGGLSLNEKKINTLKQLSNNNEIIVFTDPDGPGLKIRDKINSSLNNNCKNAFINKKNIKSKKIGIAEANDDDIKFALNNLIKFSETTKTISWEDFLNYDLFKKNNRVKIAQKFKWPEEINSKRLFKWLNMCQLSLNDIKEIIKNES
ncbi:ribonuclease M5 [Spiroplasma endosymbiont of Crioceris asparagi]|uniref:ribonuclease M5 n=1 Tax=Spiroplasma endosymbiont of Crioceris asparagi TaxID=3066286 RepID=UPI0030D5A707